MANKRNSDQCVEMTAHNDIFNADFLLFPQLLPAEVWTLVTNRLMMTSPKECENLELSSPFFQDLLAGDRTTALFGKVLPLVVSSVWKNEELDGFPMSDILNCRGVCKQWNVVIDKWIPEKIREACQENQHSSIGGAYKFVLQNYKFTNSDDNSIKTVQEFLQHFEQSHPGNEQTGRNPIIWKTLKVAILADEDQEQNNDVYNQLLTGISSVLRKYGRYIDNFSVANHREEFSENISLLRQWLSHMPNLKSLEYFCEGGFNTRSDLSTYENVDVFPQLKYLEALATEGLQDNVLNRLISQNPQISSLALSYWHPDNNIFRFSLPNLKQLELKFNTAKIIETIRAFNVQWPVEFLKLKYCSNVNPDLNGCAALFKMVQEKFATTLDTLDLNFCLESIDSGDIFRQVWEDCKTSQLDLPNLKKIMLNMSKILISLDFLLPMRHNLEEISVYVGHGSPVFLKTTRVSGDIVQFMGFQGKMLESNIWVIFKNLRKIEVRANWHGNGFETRKYSRKDWMLGNEYV